MLPASHISLTAGYFVLSGSLGPTVRRSLEVGLSHKNIGALPIRSHLKTFMVMGGVLHENNIGYMSNMNYNLSNGVSKSTQNH